MSTAARRVDQLCRIKVVVRGQPSVIFESRDSSLNAAVNVALAGVQRAVRRKTARRRTESAEIELVVRGILPSGTVLYRRRSEMREYPIIVTDQDLRRLRGFLAESARHRSLDRGHSSKLQSELDRALVVPCDEVPVGVVTVDSLVRVVDLDTGKRSVLTLVLPDEADIAERRSRCWPLLVRHCSAFARATIEWTMPGGRRRLHIERVCGRDRCRNSTCTAWQPARQSSMGAS